MEVLKIDIWICEANVKARRNKRTDGCIYIFTKVPLKFELQCKKAIFLSSITVSDWLEFCCRILVPSQKKKWKY